MHDLATIKRLNAQAVTDHLVRYGFPSRMLAELDVKAETPIFAGLVGGTIPLRHATPCSTEQALSYSDHNRRKERDASPTIFAKLEWEHAAQGGRAVRDLSTRLLLSEAFERHVVNSRPTFRDFIDRPRWTSLDEHSDEL